MDGGKVRLVLLGASNLTMGLSTVVGTAQKILEEKGGLQEVLLAAGHGRSYGQWSRVLLRSLPGIVDCGLWRQLENERAPVYGLITDIGNDIMYGVRAAEICSWVESCVEQLRRHPARIVLTLLPRSALEGLGPLQFQIWRSLLFPGRPGSLSRVQREVRELNGLLLEMGEIHRLHVVEPPGVWYGSDAVHLRRRHWRQAWRTILGAWSVGRPAPAAAPSLARWLRLKRCLPQQRRLLGRERHRRQPAGSLADGTPVFAY